MRQRHSTSIESSRTAARDALIALVRLLARQAAQDFGLHTAPGNTWVQEETRSQDCK